MHMKLIFLNVQVSKMIVEQFTLLNDMFRHFFFKETGLSASVKINLKFASSLWRRRNVKMCQLIMWVIRLSFYPPVFLEKWVSYWVIKITPASVSPKIVLYGYNHALVRFYRACNTNQLCKDRLQKSFMTLKTILVTTSLAKLCGQPFE